jgi:hypothetical protein
MKKKVPNTIVFGLGGAGKQYGAVSTIGVMRVCRLAGYKKKRMGKRYKDSEVDSQYVSLVFATEESILEFIDDLKLIHFKMKKARYARDNAVGHPNKRPKVSGEGKKR